MPDEPTERPKIQIIENHAVDGGAVSENPDVLDELKLPEDARPDDTWTMVTYLRWSERWRNLKKNLRPDAVWEYYKTLPEWQQGVLLLAAILFIIGSIAVVRTTLQLSEPLPAPQVQQTIEPPTEEEVNKVAEENYSQAEAMVSAGQYSAAISALETVPDGFKDKATLKAEADKKLKEESDKARFSKTYEDGLAALASGDYARAVETFQILIGTEGASMYRDADVQIKNAFALSASADAAVADEALGDLSALNAEQRERKALRIYNLAFMRDSAGIADSAYRAREALLSVANGWRSYNFGEASVKSARETVSELRGDLSAYSAPSKLDPVHSDFAKVAENIAGGLKSAESALARRDKQGLNRAINRLQADNSKAVALREKFNGLLFDLDVAQREGSVFSKGEIDKNLKNER